MNDRTRKFIVRIENTGMKNGVSFYYRTARKGFREAHIASHLQENAAELTYTRAHEIRQHYEKKYKNNKYTKVEVICVDLYDGMIDDLEALEIM